MMNRPVALVTGATRGIGRAIAAELSSTHRILVGGRNAALAGAVAAELGDAAPFVCDLTDEEEIAAACRGIEHVEVLVHSAGIGRSNDIAVASRALWREVFETNVFAVADLTRILLPALEAARGIVITINSGAGFFSSPGGGVYAGSKFALRALTDALREEVRGKVRVCSIHPGRTDTDMQRELQAAMGNDHYDGTRYVAPESVAAAARLAVDTPENATVEQLSIRPSVF